MSGAPFPEVRNSHLAGVLERKRALRELERQRRSKEKRLQELCPLFAAGMVAPVVQKDESPRVSAGGKEKLAMSKSVDDDLTPGYCGVFHAPGDWIPVAKKPTCVFARVTPALAKLWLGLMGPNRSLSQPTVDRYVRDRVAGNWLLSNQGVGFDRRGTPFDLQHRMNMVIQSNKPTDMLVVYGLEPAARDIIDAHRKRTLGGQMQIDEVQDANRVAAIAREIWRIAMAFNGECSINEGKAVATKHEPSIRWIIELQYKASGSFDGKLTAPMAAPLCIAWERDKGAITDLAEGMWNGNFEAGSPAHALLKYFRQLKSADKTRAQLDSAPERLEKILRACYGAVQGETEISQLKRSEAATNYYLKNRRNLLP